MSQGGSRHEHIAWVRWYNPKTAASGDADVAGMVKFIREGNRAYVSDGHRSADVGVVEAHPPYIRTYADKVWTDNLLALPRF